MSETGTLVPRVYGNFRGVDFRGDEISLQRSPDSLNVWKDYKETESIRTRPGMKLVSQFGAPIYGLFFYNGLMLVHSGTDLYKVADGEKTVLFSGLNAKPSNAFVYDGVWYFKDGKHYLRYDGSEIKDVVGYVPTTSIARMPVKHVHTDTFTGDGETTVFYLKHGGLDTGYAVEVKIYGSVTLAPNEYTVDYLEGKITLAGPVAEVRDPEGNLVTDNISVTYRKTIGGGGGETHEDVNMLSPYRINTFLADGEGVAFYLDTTDIDSVVCVKVNDKVVTNYTVNLADGCISFTRAPEAPLTDGQDNVSIEFQKTYSDDSDGNRINIAEKYRNSILNCSLLQVFDNRVFVSGNDEHPSTVWHCSLNDPTYFSDLDYYREGLDSARVKGIVAGNNALWVFREPSDSNTNVFYHTPAIDSEYGKIYPSAHSSITTGCVGTAINFNDDIVFFSDRGMEGISGDITTEQAVAHRSSLVDRKMIAEADYENMILAEWEGYLLVFIGDKVYLADSRTAFTYENHVEYEWFYWQLEKKVTSARVNGGVLYLGTEDGVYTLTDTECNVESFWTTPKDKFRAPNKLKTTNKKGCVVEALGDIAVYAKTEDSDYELIDSYEGITDYFACRVKKKKFKDLQLKFYSKTRFSLETVTLEAIVGGYIKR
jgi:hypothetical protein